MPTLDLNFNDIPSFEPLPKGKYSVVVRSVELRPSQSSDNPYLNFQLEVTEGEYAGRVLFLMSSTSPKSLWRLLEHLKALGVELPDNRLLLETEEDTNFLINPQMVGLPAIANVIQEVYEGRLQNKVDQLFPMTPEVQVSTQPQQSQPVVRPAPQMGQPKSNKPPQLKLQ